ncbi:hypothetical protein [Robiginitalea aurantiaca]|uniref:Adhesin domain-containing protein n=1 Tax=Robiginitalea aurantiaca TaxID=3056915 RepID=A0ABT7WED4_9FLAO|nr:hypothetical protein [Robiginitalea aurantiaca]MDM9631281.1 hypothetical protein [Robiginitalea aurantiaca]
MPHLALKQKTCRSNIKSPSGLFLNPVLCRAFFACYILGCGIIYGQKQLTKTLLNPGISSVSIDGTMSYKLELQTGTSKEVSVEAQMEGEYSPDLMVLFRESGTTLFIETRFSPNFEMPNDKLGAHKVISISLKVTVPENQDVFLNAASCQLTTFGVFKNLDIVFNDGGCNLSHRAENTEVQTGSAPIIAHLKSGVIEARSKYGEVHIDPLPRGDHHLKLHSTQGNISVLSL